MSGTAFGRRLTDLGYKVEKSGGHKWRFGIGLQQSSVKLSRENEF